MKFLYLIIPSFILGACQFTPEEPGLCKLNCGSAIIGGNDSTMTIALKTAAPATACRVDQVGQTIGPFTAQFVIGEKFDDGTPNGGLRPVPNISIEPLLNGLRPTLNNENDADDRYKGILTPKSNWCSDSCGVISLQVASICPPVNGNNDLSIQVHSGALYSDEATFTITTPEDD